MSMLKSNMKEGDGAKFSKYVTFIGSMDVTRTII